MEKRETILDWTTAGIPWVKSAYIINPHASSTADRNDSSIQLKHGGNLPTENLSHLLPS